MRTGLLLVLLAVAVLVGLRLSELGPAAQQPVDTTTPRGSDYYMLDAVVRQMADDGRPKYRMTVAKTLHYPDDSARLEDIHVHYTGQAKGPWDLYADTGQVPAGKHNILLKDHVRVMRQRPSGNTRLTTSRAWVYPDADRVDTDAPVEADGPGRHIRARGMTIHLDRQQIKFNQDVRVHYTP